VIQNDFKNIPIRSCVNPDEGCFEMKENSSGSAYRSYSYPGNYHDYRRQALVFSRAFGGVLIIAVLAVLALDRLFLAMEKVRIPGGWPLRADLKPRLDTVRSMIRIRLRRGPSITFVSGLTGEDELMERIRTSAGLEPEP
jgi:hypothetical protein